MTIRRVRAGAVLLVGLMLMPLAAYSDDAADANAALDRAIELLNARDVDAFAATNTENFIGFIGPSPIVVDGRDAFIEGVRQANAFNERSQFVILGDRQVRINGRTAVIAYTAGNFVKPTDGPPQSAFFNVVHTWVKNGREWKSAAVMLRRIPNGSAP